MNWEMLSSIKLADWRDGRMEEWKSGRMEEWKSGRMEGRRMEGWKGGGWNVRGLEDGCWKGEDGRLECVLMS